MFCYKNASNLTLSLEILLSKLLVWVEMVSSNSRITNHINCAAFSLSFSGLEN